MKTVIMRVLSLMLCQAMVCPLLSLKVRGQEDTAARQLPFWSILKEYSGFAYIPTICDGYETTISVSTGPAKLILEHSDGIGSLYFIFAKEYVAMEEKITLPTVPKIDTNAVLNM